MKQFAEISKNSTTVVRVTTDHFQGRQRLDIRECMDLDGSGEHRLTKRGVNVPVRDLPALRAALEAAEADALRLGHLEAEDYDDAGLSVPAELLVAE